MCFERARESSLMLSASIVTDMSTCQCRLVPSLHTGWYVYLVLKPQNLITLLSLSFSTTILIFSPDSLIVKLHVDKSPWSLRFRSVLVWKTCFFFAHLNKDSASVALIEVQFIIPSDLGCYFREDSESILFMFETLDLMFFENEVWEPDPPPAYCSLLMRCHSTGGSSSDWIMSCQSSENNFPCFLGPV